MFDDKPSTSAERAIAATAASTTNNPQRGMFLYIEDMFDPDKHPPEDQTKYVVPKENWLVFDVNNGVILRVAHVDSQATQKATLVPWALINGNEDATTEQDWIYGLRGGPMAGEALLSIDYSVRPNVARVDATIMRPGAAYAKVFLGSAAVETAIISAQYDKSNNMTTNKVPCKLAEIVDRTNVSIMTTGPFSVTMNEEALKDGTRCWLVFYDEGGDYIPPAQPLMVQHCSYMKDHQIGTKYVTEVELLSPWFTNTMDPELLIIPMNVLIPAVELRAIVHYSDGSVSPEPLPVNGERFSLYGVNEYRPTWPGQEGELNLIYKHQPNEQAYMPKPGTPDHTNRIYRVQSAAVKGAYSPKIYTFPVWDPAISGWSLSHYLYDLDRKTALDVTAKVTFNDKSEPWRPVSYGVSQSLIFNLNLKDVSPLYESVIFNQHTTIILYKDINGTGKRWDVGFSPNKPFYGGMFAKTKNAGITTTVNISQDIYLVENWLKAMYRGVEPSYNRFDEEKAPEPTHFYLMHPVDKRKWRFTIATDWNKNNVLGIQLQQGQTWFIQWVSRDAAGVELQLGQSAVTVDLLP